MAFDLVDVPLIPSSGTALGWWRGLILCCMIGAVTTLAECGIIKHTEDLDAFVPQEYIISPAHYILLQV
jgi:hypothetical protein